MVYNIHCTICNEDYVGENSRTASARALEHLGDIPTAQAWLDANPNGDVANADGLSMWAIDACKDHPGVNIAEHTAIGLVKKCRSYSHKCTEGSYIDVFKCDLNRRAGGVYDIARLR